MNRTVKLIIGILLINWSVNAQKSGVNFFKGSLKEGLALAKKENKKVFIDVYTTWCGPCKKMSKEVFPVKKVGDFYNANYISLKIDAEKGEGVDIARQYKVSGYPTLLYLDTKGEVIKKVTSYLNEEAFIVTGKEANSSKDNTSALKTKFAKGGMSEKELYTYMVTLKNKEDYKEAEKVFDQYFVTQVKNNISEELMNQVQTYARSSKNASFQYVIQHKGKFDQKIGKEKVDEMIRSFYLGEFRQKYTTSPSEYKKEKDQLSKVINIDDQLSLRLDSDFYLRSKNEEKYFELADQLITNYYSKNDLEISNMLGGALRFATKKSSFQKMRVWAEKALKIKENSLNLITLASVYVKLNDRKSAEKYFDSGLKKSLEDKDGYHERIKGIKEFMIAQIKD